MKFRVVPIVSATLIALSLSACSTFDQLSEDSKIDYRSARQRSTLDLPPDIASPRSDERLAVPSQTLSGQQNRQAIDAKDVSKQPVLPLASGMKMERAGSQRWLSVAMEPAKAFAFVREFWLDSGFASEIDSPQTGVFETVWAENRAKLPKDPVRNLLGKVFDSAYSTGERDKYRTRIEANSSGGSEIYVSHRGMVEVYSSASKDSTVWQARPIDPDLEAEFLQRMIVRFGASQEQAKAAVAGTAPAETVAARPADKARIVEQGASKSLLVDDAFDRAWRRVGLSLDRTGFTVEDRDRTKGIYFVRFVDPDVEAKNATPGLWARISGSRPDLVARQFRIVLAANGTPNANSASATQVVVQDKAGVAPSQKIEQQLAEKILERLRDDLK